MFTKTHAHDTLNFYQKKKKDTPLNGVVGPISWEETQ